MKTLLFFSQFLTFLFAYGQQAPTNVYYFPGTGSDERIFTKIQLPSGYVPIYIQYSVPEKNATMAAYAMLMAQQIDTTQPFVLVGMSIGGMICTELAEQLKPQKTIIISSAKCRMELPRHYRFQQYIPLNRLFGAKAIKFLSPVAQYVVEPDSRKHRPTFKAMLRAKDPKFLKRAVHLIINWERTGYSGKIIHIHGDNDRTLPLKNTNPSIIIKDGSHMMVLTRGDVISQILTKILSEK